MPNAGSSETLSGRDRLIEATLTCLADEGSRGTTLRKIASIACVTPGLVRYHFESKDALLATAYRKFNQDIDLRLASIEFAEDWSIEQSLRYALRAYFPEDLTDTRKMREMVAFWELILTNAEIATIQKHAYTAIQNFFVGLIERFKGPVSNVENLAIGIISVTDGLWLECCFNPERMAPNEAVDIAYQFSLSSLSGLPALKCKPS
jgi:TetR/AcrR family transcriptional repressor of bet genes